MNNWQFSHLDLIGTPYRTGYQQGEALNEFNIRRLPYANEAFMTRYENLIRFKDWQLTLHPANRLNLYQQGLGAAWANGNAVISLRRRL